MNKAIISASRQTSPYVYDPVFLTNVKNKSIANGYTALPEGLWKTLDKHFRSLKINGIWNPCDCYLFMALSNSIYWQTAQLCWKTGAVKTFNNGTFTANGFKGNGTNAYIGTGINASLGGLNMTQNNAGVILTVYEQYASGDTLFGLNTTTSGATRLFNSNSLSHRFNGAINVPVSVDLSGTGTKAAMRANSTTVNFYNKNVEIARTVNSSAPDNSEFTILKRGTIYGDAGIADYWSGSAVSNTEVQAHRASMNLTLQRLGLAQVA